MQKLNRALIFLFAIFSLASFLLPSALHYSLGVQTSAKAMCVMESSSNRVLYSKNMEEQLPMASTTKIMTAITAIENCDDLDKKFVISDRSVGIPGTSIYLRKGEVMSMRDLLYGLMLVSGNDASFAIGEQIAGNVDDFVALMNNKAQKIGATNTHFDNTHGLDSKTHYTTAYDLALITSYALKNPIFKEIVSTQNTKIINEAGKTRYLHNKNKLLASLDGCCGVKTGYTDDAGRCLVSSVERDGMTVVCVVLNCGPMFEESATLLENAFQDYKLINLMSLCSFSKTVKLDEMQQDYVNVDCDDVFYPLTEKEMSKLKFDIELPQVISTPLEKGEIVGQISIYLDKDLLFCQKIFTIEDVRRLSAWDKFKKLFS